MTRVVVIMQHEGMGNAAEPIAIITLDESDPDRDSDWKVWDWLRSNGWDQFYSHDLERMVWAKVVETLYGTQRKFVAITEPMTVVD